MKRLTLLLALGLLALPAVQAQNQGPPPSQIGTIDQSSQPETTGAMTVARIKEKGLRQVPPDELHVLLMGARVTNIATNNSERNWTNTPDGTISGLRSNSAGQIGAAGGSGGTGTWRIDEKGQWCADIIFWGARRIPDTWCRALFRDGNKYYGVPLELMAKNSNARVPTYTFSK